ncbi:TetR/AcrR family transcriptional regulator [Subtercola sp. YIM 133946]|uniref:TetR/AcrR family transcriptional regulator n=1 Tax=Subtercola sp. YIM 133946 TaxID=3118909 RepID=UPI002F92ABCF
MPRVVDHDARRRDIVEALLAIAARDGLHAATSRAIAAELGVATGALWHYFPNFDAVLSAAFGTVFARTNARIDEVTRGRSGLDAVRAMMREILPTGKETQDEAHLVVGFWGRVAVDPGIASHQIDYEVVWRARLDELLRQAIANGELVPGTDVQGIVDLLIVLSAGQQVSFVLGSALGAPEKQLPLVEVTFAPWLSR